MTGQVDKLSHLIDLFDYLPLSNRNYIVDGNFDFWISSSVTGSALTNGAATMYYNDPSTSGTATVSMQTFASGAEPVGATTPVQHYMKHSQTVASSGAPSISQRIESVRTLGGRSATFSCWLWCDSGTVTIPSILLAQNFGVGGSPSAQVNTNVALGWVVTTTPQRFSVRVDLPSITGKTIGTTANTDYLNAILYLPVGSTFALNTAQWQLEQCSPQAASTGLPTAFEYRGYGPELIRSQRYYQSMVAPTTVQLAVGPGLITGSTTMVCPLTFPTVFRSAPTMTYSNLVGSSNALQSVATSASLSGTSAFGTNIGLTTTATWTSGQAGILFIGTTGGSGGSLSLDARL